MVAIRLLCLLPLAFSLYAATNPYNAVNITNTEYGLSAMLQYNPSLPQAEEAIPLLSLDIYYYNSDTCQIRITDANNKRWEPPIELQGEKLVKVPNYSVKILESPVGITVTRTQDDAVVFNLAQDSTFMFKDHDIFIVNEFDSDVGIYGFGERTSSFQLAPGTYTMWARDTPDPYDDGTCGGNCNDYGVHPFYLAVTESGSASGGFMLNSNAMDATIFEKQVFFRFIGGIINYFIFIGPTPADVVTQYHALLGPPTLIPYWGMGWHQCRYGYHTLQETQAVVANYTKNNLPLDVIWNDIDYMDEYLNWTTDPVRFNSTDMKEWINQLHGQGKHYMCIVDAAVGKSTQTSTGETYQPWIDGLLEEIWIGSPNTGAAFVGKVWPGPACWVDYFNPLAETYWMNQFDKFYSMIPVDGIWLDMNEPSNFCNGECGFPESNFPLDFIPGGVNLDSKTLDLNAFHYGDANHIDFNTHSLFGFMEGKATNAWFQKEKKRPMIIARSTFATSGRYNSHWLGDNSSTWDYLKWSVAGVFNFQMFGVPIVGADICGFIGDTTEELCLRWMQLGTLYPFSRNHNNISSISQEPYQFSSAMTKSSEQSIRLRYSLLNYLYTEMFTTSMNGGMIFKPAMFVYPTDTNLHSTHAEDNFMLGDALLVHPVLEANATTVRAYFPTDLWYDFHDGFKQGTQSNIATLIAKLTDPIPIHIRGGYIVPTLDSSATAMSTADLRTSNITLTVAPNAGGDATGFMIYDDGLNPDSIKNNNYTRVEYDWTYNAGTTHTLNITIAQGGYTIPGGEFPYISNIRVLDCTNPITIVTENGRSVDTKLTYDSDHLVGNIEFSHAVYSDRAAVFDISF